MSPMILTDLSDADMLGTNRDQYIVSMAIPMIQDMVFFNAGLNGAGVSVRDRPILHLATAGQAADHGCRISPRTAAYLWRFVRIAGNRHAPPSPTRRVMDRR
jgi:hypothetical protein